MSTQRRNNVVQDGSSDDETYDVSSRDNYCTSPDDYKLSDAMSSNDPREVRRRGRGRGPSKRPCLNRNALMARENRRKKKEYLRTIESKLSFYQRENKTLVNVIQRQGIDVKRLSGEVAYLKSVLNNNTCISALLRTINQGLRGQYGVSLPTPAPFHGDKKLHTLSQPSNQNGCFARSWHNVPTSKAKDDLSESASSVDTAGTNDESPITNADRERRRGRQMGVDTKHPLFDSDHTYTVMENKVEAEGEKEKKKYSSEVPLRTEENEDVSIAPAILSNYKFPVSWSEYSRAEDLESHLPTAPVSTTNSDERTDANSSSGDFDEFLKLDVDVFDDLSKLDDISCTLNERYDTANLLDGENPFENIGDTGICLHVNAGKVSLEFCSICHANNINSEIE